MSYLAAQNGDMSQICIHKHFHILTNYIYGNGTEYLDNT